MPSKSWWKRKEYWIGAGLDLLSFAPEIIHWLVDSNILADYTLVAKAALPIGILLKVFGLRKSYKADDRMPSGLRKANDKANKKFDKLKVKYEQSKVN